MFKFLRQKYIEIDFSILCPKIFKSFIIFSWILDRKRIQCAILGRRIFTLKLLSNFKKCQRQFCLFKFKGWQVLCREEPAKDMIDKTCCSGQIPQYHHYCWHWRWAQTRHHLIFRLKFSVGASRPPIFLGPKWNYSSTVLI